MSLVATLWTSRKVLCAAAAVGVISLASQAVSQSIAFKQALAEGVADNKVVSAFYQERGYAPLWTGPSAEDRKRRRAFLAAAEDATLHGLPSGRYDALRLRSKMRAARSDAELGALEAELTALFIRYAKDVQTGLLRPSRVDDEIVRKVPYRDPRSTLEAFAVSSPSGFIASLHPQSREYARLMKAKMTLKELSEEGGWGPTVTARSVKPGFEGRDVVALRNRLIAMGYMDRSTTQTYDGEIESAVARFQEAHGLYADGVAGPGTLGEINKSVEDRIAQILVAMERERWINKPLGERHVWVNLTDFSAQIRDRGVVTFQTRSVIGAADRDRRSPEFSDEMEFMVINPSWYVPRSIATKEYLPMLQQNPYAVNHLEITGPNGQLVNRAAVDFNAFTAETFPFGMREPPNQGNALGLVKFMFPNRYNIYLHDTPAKSLFGREVRAFSHGCIRLNDPFDFAYALLAVQSANPKATFHNYLNTNEETRVDLRQHVPVHIIYRTAFTSADGKAHFRRDVYGRDAKIWRALQAEGVTLPVVRG
ncbi:MAG: L,D-transpeptidase family protein [Pseudomonadota bacterium]